MPTTDKLTELRRLRDELGEILIAARALNDAWGNRYVLPYLEMVTTDEHAYPLIIGSFDEWIRLAELDAIGRDDPTPTEP